MKLDIKFKLFQYYYASLILIVEVKEILYIFMIIFKLTIQFSNNKL